MQLVKVLEQLVVLFGYCFEAVIVENNINKKNQVQKNYYNDKLQL